MSSSHTGSFIHLFSQQGGVVHRRRKDSLLGVGLVSSTSRSKALCFTAVFFPLSPPPSAGPLQRGAESQPPSPQPLADSRWEPCSHWPADTPRRALAIFFCLHAARENPNNNCYCCQRSGIRSQSASQTHTGVMHKHTNI